MALSTLTLRAPVLHVPVEHLPTDELFRLYFQIMEILADQKILRNGNGNNFTADWAEYLFCHAFDWEPEPSGSQAGYDATDQERHQIPNQGTDAAGADGPRSQSRYGAETFRHPCRCALHKKRRYRLRRPDPLEDRARIRQAAKVEDRLRPHAQSKGAQSARCEGRDGAPTRGIGPHSQSDWSHPRGQRNLNTTSYIRRGPILNWFRPPSYSRTPPRVRMSTSGGVYPSTAFSGTINP